MLTEVDKSDLVRHLIPNEFLGGEGSDDLAAMGDRHQPGDSVHGRSEIVPVSLMRNTRVQTHPHVQGDRSGPRLRSDRPLSPRLLHVRLRWVGRKPPRMRHPIWRRCIRRGP